MKRKLAVLIGLASLFTLSGAGVAGATAVINTGVPSQLSSSTPEIVGVPLNAQNKIKDKTGMSFSNIYILNESGTPFIVVDPPSAMW